MQQVEGRRLCTVSARLQVRECAVWMDNTCCHNFHCSSSRLGVLCDWPLCFADAQSSEGVSSTTTGRRQTLLAGASALLVPAAVAELSQLGLILPAAAAQDAPEVRRQHSSWLVMIISSNL